MSFINFVPGKAEVTVTPDSSCWIFNLEKIEEADEELLFWVGKEESFYEEVIEPWQESYDGVRIRNSVLEVFVIS